MVNYAIFDMDGLMFDTETIFVDAFVKHIGPTLGMHITEDHMKQLIGINRKAAFALFPKLFGTEHTPEECYAMSDQYFNDFITTKGVPFKPGLIEILEHLKERGIHMAVASSTNIRTVERFLDLAGVRPYFELVYGGDLVTRGKPDPQIFDLAAEALGCFDKKDECVILEDSLNGMLAAYNAGIRGIVIPDKMDPTLANPGKYFARCESLFEAIEIIDRDNGEI